MRGCNLQAILLVAVAIIAIAAAMLFRSGPRTPDVEPTDLGPRGNRTIADVVARIEPRVSERLADLPALTDGHPITLIAMKEERMLQVWKRFADVNRLVTTYSFTAFSGELGPKLREGDGQIPEGIYRIEYLNPNSAYHLSLKLDYPNAFDRQHAKAEGRTQQGGDIMIHGSSATIGCIPIGDVAIEELFYLVAKNGYQNTTVLVVPADLRKLPPPAIPDAPEWLPELYESLRGAMAPFGTVLE